MNTETRLTCRNGLIAAGRIRQTSTLRIPSLRQRPHKLILLDERNFISQKPPQCTWQLICSHTSAAPCTGSTAKPGSQPTAGSKTWQKYSVVLTACCLCVLVASPAWAAAVGGSAPTTAGGGGMVKGLLSFILHLDKHLASMIAQHGNTTYAILFGIVFAETGLVLTPFLPGDSLLFAAGAFAATGLLQLQLLMAVFIVAAILGDACNYAVGQYFGSKALESKLINKEYIEKTEKFFAKHGAKTIVLARFVPIVRTFAPFVAGVGSMSYSTFAKYNVGGALLWTFLFCGAGYLFGNLPVVQHNFTLVVLAIVAVSVVPVILEVLQAARDKQQGATND